MEARIPRYIHTGSITNPEEMCFDVNFYPHPPLHYISVLKAEPKLQITASPLCFRGYWLPQVESHVDDPTTRARRVYHMGNLLQKRGEVKEAAKMYRSSVKLDPSHKASHYNLGKLTRRVRRGAIGEGTCFLYLVYYSWYHLITIPGTTQLTTSRTGNLIRLIYTLCYM